MLGKFPFIHSLIRDDFLRHNAVFFAGSIAVAVLNYLFHPALSRLLSVESFGEVQAIFSLSLAFGIVLSVLGLVGQNIITDKERPERLEALSDLQSFGFYFALLLALVLVIGREEFASSLKFVSALPFVLLAAITLSSVAFTFRRAYLQAARDFVALSVGGIIQSGGRLLFAVVLVALGLDTFGALAAIVIATLASYAYSRRKTGPTRALAFKLQPSLKGPLKHELPYALVVLASIGYIVFITSADVIYAKYYFDPATAGLYSGIATIGRTIYYATASISGVLLPSVALASAAGEHKRLLGKALMFLGAIGGIALLVMSLFPAPITRILIGDKFVELAPLLSRLALVSFLGSLVNLLLYYFLALREYKVAAIALFGIVLTMVLLASDHATPLAIVNAFMLGALTTVAILGALFVCTYAHHPK